MLSKTERAYINLGGRSNLSHLEFHPQVFTLSF
jgi:hypothetical protein